MYSEPISTTTPAGVGIKNPDCVKWIETLPSQEESAGRDNPMREVDRDSSFTGRICRKRQPYQKKKWGDQETKEEEEKERTKRKGGERRRKMRKKGGEKK